MADEKKTEDKRSSRTKWLDSLPDNAMTKASRVVSRAADAVGITQEEQYKDKKYQVPEKKAKGGVVSASKRADGCARKGKTKGRMV
jgi:hypothetical protein